MINLYNAMINRVTRKLAYKCIYEYEINYSFAKGTGMAKYNLTSPIEKRLNWVIDSIISLDKGETFHSIIITNYRLIRVRRAGFREALYKKG